MQFTDFQLSQCQTYTLSEDQSSRISGADQQAEAWVLPHQCSLLVFQEWGSEWGSIFTGRQRVWEGGAIGNACGRGGYDKYLLRQAGRAGWEERQSAKVENFNYIWGWVIAFLILLTLRSVSVYPPSPHAVTLTVLQLAAFWQNVTVIVKPNFIPVSCLANWEVIQKGNLL